MSERTPRTRNQESQLLMYRCEECCGSGFGALLTLGSGICFFQIPDPGSRNPDHSSFVAVFGSDIRDPDQGWIKIRMWDPESGINIPDFQHWVRALSG
jgi:hypothetical protein